MHVSFLWRIVTQPELWTTKTTWNPVARASVAVNSNVRYNEQTKSFDSDSSFYNVEAYKGTAERLAKIPNKTMVYLEWDLTNVSYKDKEWNNKSYLKVMIRSIVPVQVLKMDNLWIWTPTWWAQANATPAPQPVANTTPAPQPVANNTPAPQPVANNTPAPQPVANANPLNPADEWDLSFDFSAV